MRLFSCSPRPLMAPKTVLSLKKAGKRLYLTAVAPGGIRGILVQTLFEFRQPLLQGRELLFIMLYQQPDGRLHSRRGLFVATTPPESAVTDSYS